MVSPLSVMVIGAHHRALARGEEVQLLAQGVQGDLEVLDDRVGLVLLLERVLAGVADGVLGDVVEVADAGGLARVDELLAGLADQEGLHELLRHRHVEEVALLLLVAELDQAPLLAPADVGEGAHGDVEERVLAARHRLQHALGELLDLGRRLLGDGVLARGHYSSSASARAFALALASRASSSMRLLFLLHLRRRHLVRDLQELPLDRAGLPARDLADRGRDLLDVELEDAAPLRLVVGGLALADEGGQLAAALLGRELDLLDDVRVVGHRLLGLAGERHPDRSDVDEQRHRSHGQRALGLAQQVVAPVGAHDGLGDAAGAALEQQRDAVGEAEELDRLVGGPAPAVGEADLHLERVAAVHLRRAGHGGDEVVVALDLLDALLGRRVGDRRRRGLRSARGLPPPSRPSSPASCRPSRGRAGRSRRRSRPRSRSRSGS